MLHKMANPPFSPCRQPYNRQNNAPLISQTLIYIKHCLCFNFLLLSPNKMMLVRNNGDLCFHVHSFETLSPESCTDTLPFLKGYIRVKIMKAMNVSMCDKPSRLQCYIMCEANQKRISTGQKRHTQSQNSLLLRSWCNRYVTYVSPSPVSIQWDMTPTAI